MGMGTDRTESKFCSGCWLAPWTSKGKRYCSFRERARIHNGLSRLKIICAMDADPERVHHSLLAQVQHYANCNLFPGQEARSTILHCMQSRLFSVAGSFPVSARPV